MSRTVETAIPVTVDRNLPVSAFADTARALEASGVVDYLQTWDQLTSWLPRALWTPENTPLAEIMPDCDSFPDAFAMASYGAAVAPGLGTVVSTDSIRHGVAELAQTMMTLANMTEGRSIFPIGAGELKQTQPFGWNRRQGLGRLEDQLRGFRALWDNVEPTDFEGRHTTLDAAWVGGARPHRPRIWGLGGGPKLIDLTTSFADGFATQAPSVKPTPEAYAEMVGDIKQQLERKGRDPEAFDFGIWGLTLLHEDPDEIDRALDNPLHRWFAAIAGRIDQGAWEREGIASPMPADWHYAMDLLPAKLSADETHEIAAAATREICERSLFTGTPGDVAQILQEYVEAGATWISVIDLMGFTLPPEEAATTLGRSIELAAILKGRPVGSDTVEASTGVSG